MIEPVSSDIGRSVIYKHSHHNGKMEVYSVIEQGVITSFNEFMCSCVMTAINIRKPQGGKTCNG